MTLSLSEEATNNVEAGKIAILLALAVIALAHSDGKTFYSTKNLHQKQQHQYGSLTSYHLPLKVVAEPQVAPSPYSFGYEAEGSVRQESSDGSGRVTGSYTVTNEDGSVRVVKYVADEQGFRADIDTNEAGTKSSNPSNVAVKSAFVEPPAPVHPIPQTYAVLVQPAPQKYTTSVQQAAHKYATSVQHAPQTYVAPVQPAPQYVSSKTASYSASLYRGDSQPEVVPAPYSFGYEADGSVRQESSDGSGKVTGSYTVANEDGSVRVVKYVADEYGFRANINTNEAGTKSSNPSNVAVKSAFVEPPAPAHPIPQTYGVLLQQAPQKYTTSVQHSAQKYATSGQHSAQKYATSVQQAAQKYATSVQQAPQIYIAPVQPAPQQYVSSKSASYRTSLYEGDSQPQVAPSPYSFGYEAEGSVRQESSDGSGKVTGSYTVTNEDGSVRVVKYVADEQGFRADIDTNEAGTKSSNPSNVALKSAFVEPPAPVQPSPQIYVAPVQLAHQKYASSQAASYGGQYKQARPTIPYAFSYNDKLEDGTSSRKESADASGKVVGSYSLATADGRQRTLHYTADHEGFRAAGSQVKSALQSQTSYKGQTATQYNNAAAVEQYAPFAFNYIAVLENGTSSRSESGDASGKVIGSYSLSEKDGRKRTVEYSAGQGGFRATVNTNEFGTKSDSPADIQFYSSAPQVEPQSPSVHGRYYKTGAGQILAGSSGSQIQSGASSGQYRASAVEYTSSGLTGQYKASGSTGQYKAPGSTGQYKASGSTGQYKTSFASKQQIEPQQYQPTPYSFGYKAEAATGGGSARSESSDASGKVTGSYTVQNEDGSVRVVEYIADENGFRAKVKTNEAGTKSDDPANVSIKSNAPAPIAPIQQQYSGKASFPAIIYTPKSIHA
ncbi:hypothetical protein CDAR_301641 [Caerostris darwini]|uniref:Uncharacterized protein n=1 Tax=Caerostris darwini TaxID=1538125 RepID=A0AAV4N883_9ARAC|nr:hypothetical protein CDAR_301641 [Caerostris darwini]